MSTTTSVSPSVDRVAQIGVRSSDPHWIWCVDGTRFAVHAGGPSECRPRSWVPGEGPTGFAGPFTHVEVISDSPELSSRWARNRLGSSNRYGAVSVAEVRTFVESHGGERHSATR